MCVKSRAGFVILVAGCPVIWKSKLQGEIALSTMQAEYQALSLSLRDLLPFITLVKSIYHLTGSKDPSSLIKTTVYEDNAGALTLAQMEPGRVTPRSKHYAVKFHWFRSQLKPNNIMVEKIETTNQLADMFTKPLKSIRFKYLRKELLGW